MRRFMIVPLAVLFGCGGGDEPTQPLGAGAGGSQASTGSGAAGVGGAGGATAGAGGGVVGCSEAGEVSYAAPTAESVTFTAASDGLELAGTLHVPEAGGRFATVVLLHQYCADRSDWTAVSTLAPDLARAGFLVLHYDARGFGESTGGGQLDYCGENNATLFEPMVADVGDALAFLEGRAEANLDCLAVAGASMGSNVSLIFGSTEPRVLTTVLFSPGLNYLGLSTQNAIDGFDPRASLMFATEQDTYSANTLVTLGDKSPAATTVTLPGDAHGAAILTAHPDAHTQTLSWLGERL